MVGIPAHRSKREAGQAIVLVTLAISIFLLGAVGLAIDGSQLYAQRQMAQRAADAAATAGITSVFNNSSALGTSAYNCTATDTTSPCKYASNNGFTSTYSSGSCSPTTTSDCIRVDPNPGVAVTNLSTGTPNEVQVTNTRAVAMTVTKMLGLTSFNITARATAAIVDILSPIPILVLDPTSQGAFSINGNSAGITITGGPTRSIQVNSSATCSVSGNLGNCANTSGFVDLSGAGPSGTGAYFANVGGPGGSYPGTLTPSANYLEPVGIFQDPLASMGAPPDPIHGSVPSATRTDSTTTFTLPQGTGDCPSNLQAVAGNSYTACALFKPGYYDQGINLSGVYAIFEPGIYYINHNGFQLGSNTIARMAVTSPYNADPLPSTDPLHTGWASGMLVYNNPGVDGTNVKSNKDFISIGSNSGQINNHNFVDATNCPSGGNCFIGANGGVLSSSACTAGTAASNYYGVLFYESHTTAASLTHSLSGGGGLSIVGTVYLKTEPSYQQALNLQGTSGSTTKVQGEIIVDDLGVGGTAGITMNLSNIPCFKVRQIALVNGE